MVASSSVESPAELIEVLLQVRLVETVVRAHDEGAEVADEGVNVRQDDVCLALADGVGIVREAVVFQRRVHREAVGAHDCSRFNDVLREADDRRRIDGLHRPHLREPHVLFPFLARQERHRHENGRLLRTPASFLAFRWRSDEHLVHLDATGQQVLHVPFRHGVTHALKNRPRGWVADAELLREEERGESALVRCYEEDGDEPFPQRRARAMEDRAGGRRHEAVTAIATIPSGLARLHFERCAAAVLADHAVRPPHVDEVVLTCLLARERVEQAHDTHTTVGVAHDAILRCLFLN